MNALIDSPALSDELLVARHLAGDGTAFRRIVERYQGAVCAVAYSACGDLAASEDVAQEAFVAACLRPAEAGLRRGKPGAS